MLVLKVLLLIVFIPISLLLIVVILLQSSKGGGLSGTFGGTASTAIFGPRDTATALVSITKYLAVAFLVLSLVLSLLEGQGSVRQSVTQQVLESTPAAQLPPVQSLDFGATPAPSPADEFDESAPLDDEPITE